MSFQHIPLFWNVADPFTYSILTSAFEMVSARPCMANISWIWSQKKEDKLNFVKCKLSFDKSEFSEKFTWFMSFFFSGMHCIKKLWENNVILFISSKMKLHLKDVPQLCLCATGQCRSRPAGYNVTIMHVEAVPERISCANL